MPLTVEQRHARGQLAALRRHHGDDAELPPAAAELEQQRIRRHIEAIDEAGRRGQMTAETKDLLSRLFRYGPPPAGAA